MHPEQRTAGTAGAQDKYNGGTHQGWGPLQLMPKRRDRTPSESVWEAYDIDSGPRHVHVQDSVPSFVTLKH